MNRQRLKHIVREEIEALTERESTWSKRHRENKYKMTREEYASHRSFLERSIPLVKQLDLLIDNAYRSGIFEQSEVVKLQEAKQLIESAQIPVALIDVVDEEPKFRIKRRK